MVPTYFWSSSIQRPYSIMFISNFQRDIAALRNFALLILKCNQIYNLDISGENFLLRESALA